MFFKTLAVLAMTGTAAAPAMAAAGSATLRGSPSSMERQHEVAEEQVEADSALLGGQVKLDRDGDQPELDRPPPHGSSHWTFLLLFSAFR